MTIFWFFSDAMARRGDLIACEVNLDGATDDTIPVVFLLNGREIARASMMCAAGQARSFPYISMGIKGIQVLAQVRLYKGLLRSGFMFSCCVPDRRELSK